MWADTKAWCKALTHAGIEGFRWHGLTYTWASWRIQNGTLLHVVHETGGWESGAMVGRYVHLAPASLQRHAEVVSQVFCGTNSAKRSNENWSAYR